MRIKLKDNTELTVTDACTSTSIVAEFTSVEEIEDFRKKLTNANLSFFAYVNDDGKTVGEYKDCTFVNVTYAEKGGKYTATYNIRQYSDMEVRLNALEKEQTLQGDAIASMSETVYA